MLGADPLAQQRADIRANYLGDFQLTASFAFVDAVHRCPASCWKTWKMINPRTRVASRAAGRKTTGPRGRGRRRATRAQLVKVRAACHGRRRPRRNGDRAARPGSGTFGRADLADHWVGSCLGVGGVSVSVQHCRYARSMVSVAH